ncbi:disease resistance protein RPM1-like [Telopea speciosissima]|uniref:disease resistance protein RPM1-like n=1 Tax=Telopea speciosissima TaxID=54955 RepID=UPI001CC823BF|nr:disease resistance protein RPM1-like [Telopea speciosissima]
MADSAVGFLLGKFDRLLQDELRLLGQELHSEFRYIKDELETMQAVLRDANAWAEADETTKAWIKQVKSVVHDTEDVVDEFVLHVEEQNGWRGPFRFLRKITHFIKHLRARRGIATRILEIKTTVRDISERRQRYDFGSAQTQALCSNSTRNAWHDLRGDALLLEETELIGIEKPREELISWLMGSGSMFGVASVVGMAGLGKTTLLKKVYDNPRVKKHFDNHVWLTASQNFKRVDELMREIIKQFNEERAEPILSGFEAKSGTILQLVIKKFLQNSRYVFVFDDLWSMHTWEAVKYAFPRNPCGSRIIITTRFANLASSCIENCGYVYNLQPLSPKESWTLFCKKAFISNDENSCPAHLEQLSQNLLRRCEGLPLAIVAIGGVLSIKDNSMMEWQMVYQSLGSELENCDKLKSMERVLSLSYDYLPYYLKTCFLYLGIFPGDEPIECMRLIRLWMAEGFIEEKRGKTIEEVAESYLIELINRSLIQIAEKTIDGRVKLCRVHDLMCEIILIKIRDENFGAIVTNASDKKPHEKIRHLSICGNDIMWLNKSFPCLHSLFMVGASKLSHSSTRTLFCGLRLLKVLDLRGSRLVVFPNELVDLFHLRYLSLRGTNVKMLPNCIRKLKNLETLDLKDTCVSELPIGILKLQRLRHLLAYRYRREPDQPFHISGFKVPNGIGCLVSLQNFCFIRAEEGKNVIRGLGRLSQLRRLGIIEMRRGDGFDLCSALEKMKNLRSLNLSAMTDERLSLQSLSSPPLFLQRFYLRGCLEELPHWISTLHNLVSLHLRGSRLIDDPLEALQALPNLLELTLDQAYSGEILRFKERGFQRIKILRLDKLRGLRRVELENGALPQLQKLYIQRCEDLDEVPFGIEHLTCLKELKFSNMPTEFVVKVQKALQDEDDWKVAHIPLVYFVKLVEGRSKRFHLSQSGSGSSVTATTENSV